MSDAESVEDAYELCLGLIAAVLDPAPGDAFRAMLGEIDPDALVELIWIQASLSATLLRANAGLIEIDPRTLLQALALRTARPTPPA